jgi:protein-disulfide isomerase
VSSGIKEATVMADEAEGEKASVNSTPSYFVNGVRVQNNNVDAISAAIDKAMQQTQNAPL